MPAFNAVRFKVKPGREEEFLNAHKKFKPDFKGFKVAHMIKTGDRAYCFLGEWNSYEDIVNARPTMIKQLDSFRDCLEDLGNGLGVTDPVSGSSILELR